jgi:hypothetical protein
MPTKRYWAALAPELPSASPERRTRRRQPADFYGVEVVAGNRYLRRIKNVSSDGLTLVNPLGDEQPGQVIDMELPRRSASRPVARLQFEVVYVEAGKVGVRRLDAAPLEIDKLGGPIAL